LAARVASTCAIAMTSSLTDLAAVVDRALGIGL